MNEIWTLVFINMAINTSSGYDEPFIEGYWSYPTMIECFDARATLGYELTGNAGYFPSGTQAVCIKKEIESL